jgi:hypothetical protein
VKAERLKQSHEKSDSFRGFTSRPRRSKVVNELSWQRNAIDLNFQMERKRSRKSSSQTYGGHKKTQRRWALLGF